MTMNTYRLCRNEQFKSNTMNNSNPLSQGIKIKHTISKKNIQKTKIKNVQAIDDIIIKNKLDKQIKKKTQKFQIHIIHN